MRRRRKAGREGRKGGRKEGEGEGKMERNLLGSLMKRPAGAGAPRMLSGLCPPLGLPSLSISSTLGQAVP